LLFNNNKNNFYFNKLELFSVKNNKMGIGDWGLGIED